MLNLHLHLLTPFFISGIESDVIDEAIYFFKANVFFKNFEIKVGYLLSFAIAACISFSFKVTTMFKEINIRVQKKKDL